MGSSANERIALNITTSADLGGIDAARAGIGSLGAAAAAAGNEAATSQKQFTITAEQSAAAWKGANGSVHDFNIAITQIVDRENALAAAAAKASSELQRQSRVSRELQGPSAPQLGPALPGMSAGGGFGPRSTSLAELAAYRMEGDRTNSMFEKMPRMGMHATSSLGILAQSAAMGTGSIAGLGSALGMASTVMAEMSGNATLAANAISGGVLVAALGVLIGLAIDAKKALAEIPEGKLAAATDAHLKNLHSQADVSRELEQIDLRRAALAGGTLTTWGKMLAFAKDSRALGQQDKQLQGIVNLDAAGAAAQARQIAIVGEERDRNLRGIAIEAQAQTTAVGKYRGQLAVIESERVEAIRSRSLTESAANEKAATQRRAAALELSAYQLHQLTVVASAQESATDRYAAQLRVIDAERTQAIASGSLTRQAADAQATTQTRDLNKAGFDHVTSLRNAAAAASDAATETEYDQKRRAILRTSADASRANDLLVQSEPARLNAELAINDARDFGLTLLDKERDKSLAAIAFAAQASAATRASGSEDPRAAMQGKLELIDQEYLANIKLLGVKEALLVAEEKRRKLESDTTKQGLAGYGTLSAAVKNHGTVVGAMAKASADAVRLYEIYEKGKSAAISAQMEFAASMGSFATGNFAGGALHLAAAGGYAAAAVAAGVEAAGTVSGGGGSGSGGGSGGVSDAGSFQPRDGSDGGSAITLVLQTVNPFSKETINEVRYQLNRAGVLKRPIPIGPTTGLLGATG